MLNPLGLLALAALPAIAFLHLWRRRFRPHPVSALFLWADVRSTPMSGRKRERLRTDASFWLELAAALALALALAGPRACGGTRAEHLVVVLDGSASMGAAIDDERIRDRAIEAVRERAASLPRNSRVSLVVTGTPPKLLAGPAVPVAEALARLDGFRPRAAHHDLQPAIALGLSISAGGAVTVVTDRYEPDSVPAEIELVALGRPLANVAIAHAARSRAEDGEDDDVFVVVESHADAPATTTLRLATADEVVFERALELEPGERRELAFPVPRALDAIAVELAPDALAIDNRAVLLREPPRTIALATTLDADVARRIGIATGRDGSPLVDRWLAIVPDSIAAPDPALAHLSIGSEAAAQGAWSLVLRAAGDERRDLIGPFLTEKRHPLLRGLTLEGIVWSIDPNLVLDGAPLVSAGDLPVLTETVEPVATGGRTIELNIDPARSSLWRSPDWPIFLANLAEARRAELPGPARSNLATGEPLVYRGRGPANYRLVGPIASSAADADEPETLELASRGTLVVEGLDRPGVFVLSDEERELCRIALSFQDSAESDLTGLGSGRRPAASDRASVLAEFRWIEAVLVLVGVAALLGDWAFLARRSTVVGGER